MKKITIRDIAQEAGVSTAAVSYVINGKKGVGPQMRKKIEQVMEKHDYRPSLRSKSLSVGRNYCLHAVIRREAAPACKAFYFGVIAKMVEQETGQHSIVPVFQSDDTDADKSLLEVIHSHSTDGIIAFQGVMPLVREKLEKYKIPYVVINPGLKETGETSVVLDFEELSCRAVSYLISSGHRNIAMIGMQCMPLFFEKTKAGFLRALSDANIKPDPALIRGEADSEEGAAKAMENILKAGAPTAVFCVQDNFAISAMSTCVTHGLKVPDDVSFVAIDDIPEAKYLNPPLTTIPVSPAEIAQTALSLISAKMKDGSADSIVLPSHDITVRSSVRTIQPALP